MEHTIANRIITFVSDSVNVEPRILRFNGDDGNYFWQDGEHITAICFPLLGALPDNAYTLDGKRYPMPMHGFAQNYDFRVAEHTECRIVYEITDDAETYKQYPYRFRLRVAYALEDATLTVTYGVQNRDAKELYFSMGGHPRFACPVGGRTGGVSFADHRIEFEKPEGIDTIVKSYGPLERIEQCFSPDHTVLRLEYRLFEKGCFCFSPLRSAFFTLKNTKNTRALRFHAETVTHFQLWAMPGAPYIALEPWYGSITALPPNPEDTRWTERPGTLHIPPAAECTRSYALRVMQ